MLCLYLCIQVFITACHIIISSFSHSPLLSSNCFYSYTHTLHIIRYSKSVWFDCVRYMQRNWLTSSNFTLNDAQVNRSVIVLHFNCFTFHTYWILFSFTLLFSVSFLTVSWLWFIFVFFLQKDRYIDTTTYYIHHNENKSAKWLIYYWSE